MTTRSSEDIAKEFIKTTRALINLFKQEAQTKDIPMIDIYINRFNILNRSMGAFYIFDVACPFFIKYAQQILSPNQTEREDFLNKLNVISICDEYCSNLVSKNELLTINELSKLIKKYYFEANNTSKTIIYDHVKSLTSCCIEYQLHHK